MEPFDASQSLAVIHQARNETRKALARAGTGYFFIIWGIVWLFGFLGSQILPGPLSGYLWLALDTFGVVGSIIAGIRYSQRVRSSGAWRVIVFWLLLTVQGGILMWITWPLDSQQYLMFVTILIAMGYGLLGIWINLPLAIIGVSISALAVMGWLLIPAYLGYWLALVGGGGLIGAGLYVLKAWK
jgi:hypothetical protein